MLIKHFAGVRQYNLPVYIVFVNLFDILNRVMN